LIRTFPNTSWVSASVGYGQGGESQVNNLSKGDERGDLLWALSGGVPLFKTQGLKLTYLHNDNRMQAGGNTNSLLLSWNVRF